MIMKNIKFNEINWPTTLYLILTPIGAIVTIYFFALYDLFQWQTILLAIFMWLASGMAITVGYHRYFSHRSYKVKKWMEYLYVIFGTSAMEMSVIEWTYDHRNHHRFTDTEKDPYSIKEGFWYAHILWMFTKRGTTKGKTEIDFNKVSDLTKDKFLMFQHKYYIPFAVFMTFIFPGLIAMLWGDFWGGVLIAGLVRSVIVHHGTFAINSVCHSIGKRPYSLDESARDSWISALLTYGEGYHNFHHKFPGDYRNAILPWQYDPSKWFIWTLSKLGIAWDLHKTPEERILQARIEVLEKQALQNPNLLQDKKILQSKERFQNVLNKIVELKEQYNKTKSISIQMIEKAKKDLIEAYKEYSNFLKRLSRINNIRFQN